MTRTTPPRGRRRKSTQFPFAASQRRARQRRREGDRKLIEVDRRHRQDRRRLHAARARLKTLRQVAPLLTHAADLMQQGRALSRRATTRSTVYRQVLELDPANKLADQGLAQIERDFLDRALAAAAQDDYAGADKILDQAAAIRPGSQNLLDTRTRIEGIRRQRAANTMAQANSALDAGDPNLAELLAQKALADAGFGRHRRIQPQAAQRASVREFRAGAGGHRQISRSPRRERRRWSSCRPDRS